jgi:hypothetical protein
VNGCHLRHFRHPQVRRSMCGCALGSKPALAVARSIIRPAYHAHGDLPLPAAAAA